MGKPRKHDGVAAPQRRLKSVETKILFLKLEMSDYLKLLRLAGKRSVVDAVTDLIRDTE